MIYGIEDIEAFIEHCISTGDVPENNILTHKETLKAEDKACKSDKAMEKGIHKCAKRFIGDKQNERN